MKTKHPGRKQAEYDRMMRRLRIEDTPVGHGVFARRRIAADVVVGEIFGEVLDEHPADSSYCMELQSGRLLEPEPPLRFVNHCCEPNCELFYWVEEDQKSPVEDRLWLQTLRPIAAGEQLTIDYCWPADAAIRCLCGAATCRGWIVDPDEFHLLPTSQPEAWAQYLASKAPASAAAGSQATRPSRKRASARGAR